MKARRRLLALIVLGALPASRFFAQEKSKVWRIGILALEGSVMDAFVQGMRDLGYVEGKNLVIERRIADGNAELVPAMAAELVRLKVDVIVASSSVAIRAARQATATIPIVAPVIVDPVGSGFASSLSRPGSNITGLSNIGVDVSTKHLEFLSMMVPKLSRVSILVNLDNSAHPAMLRRLKGAAKRMSIEIFSVDVRTPEEIEAGFASMKRDRTVALIIAPDAFLIRRFDQIAKLATEHGLPSAALYQEYAARGGLITYGPSLSDFFRRTAYYVDRIFKGEKPADMPIEQPTKFELVINRKTATTLGLKISQELLLRVDRVIQ